MPEDEGPSPESSTGINWDNVLKTIETEGEEYTDECGNRVKSLYLGSVLSLSPSGKYYTPYASGNVEPEEAEADQAWYNAVDEEAAIRGLTVVPGEGDPTDLIVLKVLGTDENPACERDKQAAADRHRPHL